MDNTTHVEVVDLLDSDDDIDVSYMADISTGSRKRSRDENEHEDEDWEAILPSTKKAGYKDVSDVIVLNSDPPTSSDAGFDDSASGKLITIKYRSRVPGHKGTGEYQMRVTDYFEDFASKFSNDLDDIEISCNFYDTEWYGTPQVFLLDKPDATSLDVTVSSKSHPDEEFENAGFLIKIQTANGRCDLRVKKESTVAQVIDYVAKKYDVDPKKCRAEFEDPLDPGDTMQEIEIEEDDVIDVAW